MKKFKGYDYSFCNGTECKISNTCMRYIKHYELGDRRISIIDSDRSHDMNRCDLYIDNRESDDNERN